MMNNASRSPQLQDFDEALLADGGFVPRSDGFEDDVDTGYLDERYGKLWSTCYAMAGYLACSGCFLGLLFWQLAEQEEKDFAIKVTGQVTLLLLAALLEWYLRWKHRQRQRLGYLDFYQRVRKLQSIPLLAAGAAAATMLLALAWPDIPPTTAYNQLRELKGITIAQCAVTLLCALAYGYQMWRHARKEEVPDALQFLQSAAYADPQAAALRRQDPEVEHQGRVIDFMKKRCRILRREVLELHIKCNALREAQERAGEAVRADMGQVLAARERELRGVLAEKDVLTERNRHVALLLEEKTAALHQQEEVAAQQREENERLRANLEEWSKRNAKLELRMNAYRQQVKEQAEREAGVSDRVES